MSNVNYTSSHVDYVVRFNHPYVRSGITGAKKIGWNDQINKLKKQLKLIMLNGELLASL